MSCVDYCCQCLWYLAALDGKEDWIFALSSTKRRHNYIGAHSLRRRIVEGGNGGVQIVGDLVLLGQKYIVMRTVQIIKTQSSRTSRDTSSLVIIETLRPMYLTLCSAGKKYVHQWLNNKIASSSLRLLDRMDAKTATKNQIVIDVTNTLKQYTFWFATRSNGLV